jgi:hypothetical protein
MSGVTQRTALLMLGGLVITLVAFVKTRSNAVVAVMGVVLLLFMLSQQRRQP